ncbi:hypothetical protein M3Y99_01586300 [Aphelenchoides fujianensis]|nr:hypothetical protein M3Y99_01586300 [Aphelenchoides fujianensis]
MDSMPVYVLPSLLFFLLLSFFHSARAQQAYCFDQSCYDCANPAPRLCPPEQLFTYYDCCLQGCCQFLKWANVIFLVIVIIALLAGCFCCCFFLMNEMNNRKERTDSPDGAAQTRRRKKSARRQMQDHEIATRR